MKSFFEGNRKGCRSKREGYGVGVYEENEYCSGNDLLVCMEDYHRLYSEFSIMDESFFFERIGAVYTKNEP